MKIRKSNYAELKELWEILNQKYFIYYEKLEEDFIEEQLVELLKKDVFTDVIIESKRDIVRGSESGMVIGESAGVYYTLEKPLPYFEFLRMVNEGTNLPITAIHKAIVKFSKEDSIEDKYFNEYSAANLINSFEVWKTQNLQGRFNYNKTSLPIHPTPLTNKDGTPKDIFSQGRIGTKIVLGEAMDKYLYDAIAYDSELEKDNIQSQIDEVVVFGKIPRNSIRIPTINGGTYSPDFMYVVKKTDGSKELNVVVEIKDVENENILGGIEEDKINSAKVFFNQLKIDGYEVKFETQLKNKRMKSIIGELFGS